MRRRAPDHRTPARRLCAGLSVRGRGRSADRRPQGQPAGHRAWRRRDVRGLGRHRAGADDRPDHLSRRGRLRRPDPHQPRNPRRAWRIGATAPIKTIQIEAAQVDKAGHKHFMAKEIAEQPRVIGEALRFYLSGEGDTIRLPGEGVDFTQRRPSVDGGLRHRLLCLHDREILVRTDWRACPSMSISPRNSATANRRSRRAPWRYSSASRARPPIRWPPCAIARARPRRSCRSSTCPKARSRAKAIWRCRSWRGPRSASPRPRPSPAS